MPGPASSTDPDRHNQRPHGAAGRRSRRLAALGRLRRWWRQLSLPRRIIAGLVALVVLYALAVGVQFWRIRSDLHQGQAALTGLSIDRVDAAGGVGPLVTRAADHLDHAHDIASHSLILAPLRLVPLLGTQVREIASLTGVASRLGDAAATQAARIQAQLGTGGSAGERLELLATISSAITALQHRVATLDVADPGWLLPPVQHAREELRHGLAKATTDLSNAATVVAALHNFLGRDHRVLILAANNAEMRGGNGMALSAGVATIHDGQLQVSSFVDTAALFLKDGPVPVPADLEHTYGDFFIGQEWRGTNASPDFPEVAPLYQAMAAKAGLGHVDGVIMVDADALQALLSVTGPVTLDGTSYTARNVIQEVLNENYLTFGKKGHDVHQRRVDLQSELAKKVFAEFNSRPVSATKLARALLAITPGRHLLAWSAKPGIQAAWHQLGIDGALRPDGILVSVENISANKLDYYLTPVIDLTTERRDDGNWLVTLRVSVYNPPRTRTSAVIEGGTPYVKPGDHRVYLDVHLPGDTYDVKALPADALPTATSDDVARLPDAKNLPMRFTVIGTDGPMKVVGDRYIIPYETTRTVSLTFRLPSIDNHLSILPSGRWQGQIWRYGSHSFLDDHSFRLPLEDQRSPAPPSAARSSTSSAAR